MKHRPQNKHRDTDTLSSLPTKKLKESEMEENVSVLYVDEKDETEIWLAKGGSIAILKSMKPLGEETEIRNYAQLWHTKMIHRELDSL